MRKRGLEPICFFLLHAMVLWGVGGCASGNDIPRAIVEGEVSYNGQPIKNGQISFRPIEGTPGPVSTAPIVDGKYTVTNKGGVPIGKQRVVIEGYEPPPPGADADAGAVQFVPDKFNRNSELTADIDAESSPLVRNFELPR